MEAKQELMNLLDPLYINNLDLREKGHKAIKEIVTPLKNIYDKTKRISQYISKYDAAIITAYSVGAAALAGGMISMGMHPKQITTTDFMVTTTGMITLTTSTFAAMLRAVIYERKGTR